MGIGNGCIWGSPPLTRELRSTSLVVLPISGITPAYAGTTTLYHCGRYRCWDHPRLRGNYFHLLWLSHLPLGSPPLTRELHGGYTVTSQSLGITPAYAGTTCLSIPLNMQDLGSPPLTRELLKVDIAYISVCRITPAYAGTTKIDNSTQWMVRDHPRLRGNYHLNAPIPANNSGSPPLTRELLIISLIRALLSGITPAYAGTTLKDPLFFTIIYSDIYKNHLVCL